MFASGIPSRVFFDARYPASKFQCSPKVLCSVRFHCCEYPDPLLRSTPNTPCPSPELGFGAATETAGPLDSVNAAFTLSCDCWPTVWMNGNCGIVNGVVIPDCSKKIIPYPARTTQRSPIRYASPTRGPK